MAEFAKSPLEERIEKQDIDGKSVGSVSLREPLSWRVYVDGVANHRGSGVGLVLISPERIIIEKSLRLGFLVTNNEAEYEALLVGIDVNPSRITTPNNKREPKIVLWTDSNGRPRPVVYNGVHIIWYQSKVSSLGLPIL